MAIIHQTLALVQITGQVMLCTHTMKSVGQIYIWLLKDFKFRNNVQQQKHNRWVKMRVGIISDFLHRQMLMTGEFLRYSQMLKASESNPSCIYLCSLTFKAKTYFLHHPFQDPELGSQLDLPWGNTYLPCLWNKWKCLCKHFYQLSSYLLHVWALENGWCVKTSHILSHILSRESTIPLWQQKGLGQPWFSGRVTVSQTNWQRWTKANFLEHHVSAQRVIHDLLPCQPVWDIWNNMQKWLQIIFLHWHFLPFFL